MQPTELKLKQAEKTLTIIWSDGHDFTYSLRYLRGWCPCAGCQGHFSVTKTFIENDGPELIGVDPVGNYAIQPLWGDRHESGLYSYRYLLAMEQGPPDEGPTNEDCLASTRA